MTDAISDNENETGTESSEEEVEPKLKYVRISNDLGNILSNHAVSCIAVHSKFICLGTHWGGLHLLDHLGYTVPNTIFPVHLLSINQISFDEKAEHLGSCSDDGMVNINSLYSEENSHKINIGKKVNCVELDPQFYKSGSGRRFIVGDDRLTLYEKTFLKGLKATVLSESEGTVNSIKWNGQFVAWASSLGVRVYDLNERCSLGLIKWEEPKELRLNDYRCNLRWSNATTLFIGWVDTIRICVIRKRNAIEVSTRNLPGFIVDPISTFQTDFFVCGVAPLQSNQMVVLGYPKEKNSENNKALRPLLCVLQYETSNYIEICTDSLSLRGYEEYKVVDYHLDCLIEENQYFIVSPKDIVVASLYETDDRVQWLIKHGKYEDAMEVIKEYGGSYSFIGVAKLYLDHLLTLEKYNEAARLCQTIFKDDKILWEEEIYKFVKVKQLRSISAYLPRSNESKLNPHVYEMVLYEFLQLDPDGFLKLIKEWQPSLYNTKAVINAIHDHFNKKDLNLLLEALAILYSHEKEYDKALTMYLKLQNKDVFNLIKTHDLYSVIKPMIIPLFKLDSDKTIAMLLEKNKIRPEIVVDELEAKKDYLFLYLDALDKIDNSGKYHSKLVDLYAEYDPSKLLSFLKRSNNYQIQEAYDKCKSKLFYPEMVYLLGRMGNTSEALSIIMHELNNIEMAIDFCKEHNDIDLWNSLIDNSIDKPQIMPKLLDGISGFVNPEILVNKIKMGQEIPGLKKSLVKLLCGFSLQVAIQDGCNQILVTDYFNLHQKLSNQQHRATCITHENTCGMCQRDIIVKDSLKTDVILFHCKHFFHENCLPDKYNDDFCPVCKSK